jgi:GTP cyclohydrolase I
MPIAKKKVQAAVRDLLIALGENPEREGLQRTPERVAEMYTELLAPQEFKYTSFDEEKYDGMVMVRDIEFFSMCEHHMMPFYGVAHLAYFPKNKVIGISKLARMVEKFTRSLQVQERMTDQIFQEMKTQLGTDDVALHVEAVHLCMMARGVKKTSSKTITSKFAGIFETENKKKDFYYMLANNES